MPTATSVEDVAAKIERVCHWHYSQGVALGSDAEVIPPPILDSPLQLLGLFLGVHEYGIVVGVSHTLWRRLFDEDVEAAEWNYDDYFAEKVKRAIKEITNPLDA